MGSTDWAATTCSDTPPQRAPARTTHFRKRLFKTLVGWGSCRSVVSKPLPVMVAALLSASFCPNCLGKAAEDAQALRPLLRTWMSWKKLLAPAFILTWLWLLWTFGEWIGGRNQLISLPLPISLSPSPSFPLPLKWIISSQKKKCPLLKGNKGNHGFILDSESSFVNSIVFTEHPFYGRNCCSSCRYNDEREV